MRISRRTFLVSSALTACGGTAGYESLETLKPPVKPPVDPIDPIDPVDPNPPIDPACCQPGDRCSAAAEESAIPTITRTDGVRFFVALTGQSNAVGRSPAVTSAQPFRNQRSAGAELLPLLEQDRETIKSAAANMFTHLSGDRAARFVAYVDAASATEYARIKKGSASYTRIMRQVAASKRTVSDEGEALRALAVLVIHGETDHVFRNADYAANLREWQRDFQADLRASTGQDEAVPMFTDQLSSFTAYGDASSTIPQAQLHASEMNVNRVFLVGPKYQYNYEDGKHLIPAHLQWLGEQYGKVMKRVFLDGESWRPLSPRTVTIDASKKVLRAKFHVPNGPLVIDTERVPEKTSYGFELGHVDTSVALPAIDEVKLVGEDTVELRLSRELPACARLRYAHTGTPRAFAGAFGPKTEGSARGNLRDSDPTRSFHASWDLFNWCVQFDVPIA